MLSFFLIFAATTIALGLAGQLFLPARSRAVEARLREIGTPVPAGYAPRLEGLDNRTLLRRAGRLIEPHMQRFRFAKPLEQLLQSAGVPLRLSEFTAVLGLAALGGATAGMWFLGLTGAVGGAMVAPLLPIFKVRQEANRKRRALNEQLPDALMLMVNALRAGNSLTQAMHVVAQQMPAPIATAFGQSIAEINLGLPVDTALERLQERFGGLDMGLVTTAIMIQRETGGNLAEILNNIHHTIRDRQTVQGEMRALTAQGRLSGWVLSLLPAGIGGLFFLLNRAYILLLFTDPRGQLLVGVGVVLTIIGMFAIRKIVNIAY